MNCPVCGTSDFYQGITTLACFNSNCKYYRAASNSSNGIEKRPAAVDKDWDMLIVDWRKVPVGHSFSNTPYIIIHGKEIDFDEMTRLGLYSWKGVEKYMKDNNLVAVHFYLGEYNLLDLDSRLQSFVKNDEAIIPLDELCKALKI